MPYIDYHDIKRRYSLDAMVDTLQLRVRGRSIRCPNTDAHAHGDAHPSADLSPSRLSWHCHRCGAGGSVIDLVATANGLTHHDAALLLHTEHALTTVSIHHPSPLSVSPLSPAKSQSTPASIAALLDAARTQLTYNSQGHRYLNARGIPLAVARSARLGFSPRGQWPHARGSGQPRLVAPLALPDGTVTTLYGRSIVPCPKPLRHDLLPGIKGLFNPAALTAPIAVLVEGVFDALSVLAAGFPAAALCGLTIRDNWWPLIPARQIILALDADEAGQHQAIALQDAIHQAGKRAHRLDPRAYSPYKDLNEFWTARRALPMPLTAMVRHQPPPTHIRAVAKRPVLMA